MPESAPGLTPTPLPASVRWVQGALGLGFLGLVVFLVALESVFVTERAAQRAQVAQHRQALEAYATSRFQRLALDGLDSARQTAALAREDPLQPAPGVVLFSEKVLLVPLRAGDAPAAVGDVLEVLRKGPAPATDDDTPWAERWRLVAQLRAAAVKQDRPKVEAGVRALLAHRAHYLLPPERDLPSVVVMLEALAPPLRLSPALARAVLREGFREPVPVEGLMRQVLRAAPRLAAGDIERLCEETKALARAQGVRADDFQARCLEVERRVPRLSTPPDGSPAVWLDGAGPAAWVWRTQGAEVVGASFNGAVVRAGLEAEMRTLGLFVPGDTLELPSRDGAVALTAAHLSTHVGRFDAARRQQDTAFALKTLLVAVASLLGVAMVVTALVAQRRKHRFVELKSDFISTVSHELRTPLASLRLLAETLERKLGDGGAGKDYPRRLVREVDGLSFLVENILSFNRIDKGRMVARRAPVTLDHFEAALKDEAAQYAQAKVELSFTGFEGRGVLADVGLLQLLFLNLLRNACRYSARDPVRVALDARSEPGRVVVRVKDNGVGLLPGEKESVFQPFQRGTQRGRGGAGSGLGLALCRRIAQLHGGGLTVLESSAEGTTFELTLSTR